ncbi:MAG TPA: cytochrome c biogenesis protein CcdA [Cellvibrionaceae bacterium]
MEQFIQSALSGGELGLTLVLLIFITGLLTSVTPCVYPLLPISVAVVGRQSRNRMQALGLSLVYALGLALVYAALGVLAASTGKLFGSVASHPLTLGTVAIACLLMAAWMQGWLQMPEWAPTYPRQKTPSRQGVFAVFISGLLSGLVMAPCTSPVLGMLLMFVAARGEITAAGFLMFVFAFGMCALLIAAGTFSGLLASLPRTGRWMLFIKNLLACSMLLAGLYFGFLAINRI